MPGSQSDSPETLARLAAENSALHAEILSLRRFIDSMQNLVDAAETPREDDEVMGLLEEVLQNARQTINAKDGSLLVLDEDTGELVFVIAQGDIPAAKLAWRRVPPGVGIAGWVADRQRPTIVNDVGEDERFYAGIDEEFEFKTKSLLAAPIIGGGRLLGVIEALNKRDGLYFNNHDQTLLTLVCRFAEEILHTMVTRREQQLPVESRGP